MSHPAYFTCGLISLFLNLTLAIAINFDKDMKNATPKFMIHLALADALLIFGLLLGPSATFLAGYQLDADSAAGKIFAYCNGVGYHSAVLFMVAVSFSRWVYFARKTSVDTFFGGLRHKIMCIGIWVFCIGLMSPFLYCFNAFALLPNTGVYTYTNSTYSYAMKNFDEITNVMAVTVQALFNTMSIAWIVKMRKQILAPELQAMKTRELKLFVLCFIDSSIFSLLIAVHYYSLYVDQGAVVRVSLEVLFLLNHVDCAVLYFWLNRRLREGVIRFAKSVIGKVSNGNSVWPIQ